MPRTVLVVDDERDTNDILASLVQARGFQPIQVFSGTEALEAVAEHKPDLILLDLLLAGYRRLRALRPAQARLGRRTSFRS